MGGPKCFSNILYEILERNGKIICCVDLLSFRSQKM